MTPCPSLLESANRIPSTAGLPRRAPEGASVAGASDRVLALQRAAGNQAVTSLLQSRGAGHQLQRAGDELAIPPGLTCEPATDSPPTATEVMLFPNAVSALTPEQRGLIDNVVANWNVAGRSAAGQGRRLRQLARRGRVQLEAGLRAGERRGRGARKPGLR